jgi:hypothetical protein
MRHALKRGDAVARPAAPAALHKGQAALGGGRSGAASQRWSTQVRDTAGLTGAVVDGVGKGGDVAALSA